MPLHIWQNQNQYRDGKLDNDQPHDGGKGNIDLGVYDRSGNRVRKSNGMVQLDDSVIYLINSNWVRKSNGMVQLDDSVIYLINSNLVIPDDPVGWSSWSSDQLQSVKPNDQLGDPVGSPVASIKLSDNRQWSDV